MPASYNRYQSRLFNIILQQSIRWTDRAAETFRNLQVATVWGIQALLYPAYVVVQATRNSLDRSATSQTQQFASADETPIPSTDAPIQIVLADIERGELDIIQDEVFPEFTEETLEPNKFPNNFPQLTAMAKWVKSGLNRIRSIGRGRENSSASISISQPANLEKNRVYKRQVRGLASLMSEPKLVLVNDDNQILDILNSRQQQQLERRIFVEIGNYWIARQPVQQNLSTDQKPNRLLGWMQTSPLAISLNLFQEATLASVQKNTHSAPESTPDFPNFSTPPSSESPAAASKPSTFPSVNPVQNATVDRWNSIARSAQTSLVETQKLLVEKAQQVGFPKVSDPWQTSSNTSGDRSPTIPSEERRFSESETSQKALPLAPESPDFLYHKVDKIVKSVSDSFQKNLGLVTDRFVQIADPWLSPLDRSQTTVPENLIDDNLRSKIQLKSDDRSLKQLPASRSLEQSIGQLQTWAMDSRNWLAELGIPGLEPIREVEIESASIVPATPENDLAPAQNEAMELLSNPFVWESSIATLPNPPQSNWIETEATSVEYIKHPLEQVLEWLDRIAFWLEKHIVQLWQNIQQFWQKKTHPNK